MHSTMDFFNSVCTRIADVLLTPFVDRPLLGLVFWGAITGLVMTFVFSRTSNQTAIATVANRSRAQLLAVGLFRDDLAVTLRCQIELLKLVGLRLWYSMPPMLVMAVPFFVLLTQLSLRYETLPLMTGDRATVYLYLSDSNWESFRNVSLQASEGVTIETDGLRNDRLHWIGWRVRADSGQPATLKWRFGNQTVEKTLAVTSLPGSLSMVSKARIAKPIWTHALHPAEPSLPTAGKVGRIVVDYPRARSTPVGSWDVPWWATFLVVSMVTAYGVGAVVKVKF